MSATTITTDWNWFFSSLAQSAAAIVGIFGAFIITKILNNQSAFAASRTQIQELILDGQKIADDAGGRYFEWYNARSIDRAKDRIEDHLDENPTAVTEALLKKAQFSPYISRDASLQVISGLISKRDEKARQEQEEVERLSKARAKIANMGDGPLGNFLGNKIGSAGMVGLVSNTSIVDTKLPRGVFSARIQEQMLEERDQIDIILRQARHHVRTVSRFLSGVETNPESSGVISCSLVMIAVLFIAGVIYPLSFLPMPVPGRPILSVEGFWHAALSLRGVLLLVVSVLFLAVLAMFFVMNYRMKYSRDEVQGLRDFCSLGRYSSYFAIYEDNEKPLARRPSIPPT
jgi:hypothetical protein